MYEHKGLLSHASLGTNSAVSSLMTSSLFCYENKILVEYVWLGSSGSDLRSKSRVFDTRPSSVDDVPMIAVDGGSYDQHPEGQEVFLKPRKLFRDPFRAGDHLLVLCDSFKTNVNSSLRNQNSSCTLEPSNSNSRAPCEETLNQASAHLPIFAAEQEYCILASSTVPSSTPAWPYAHLPDPCKPYMSVPGLSEANKLKTYASGRHLAERHLQACLHAGIKITETSQRTSPAARLWSYKLGPLLGVDLADQLWMSRFILLRLSEEEGLSVSFDPTAVGGAGARCNMKYSTSETRNPGGGLSCIQLHLELLESAHLLHLLAYSKGCVSSRSLGFEVGVGGSKEPTLVVPSKTLILKAGHYVDQRPPSNVDPYLAIMVLVSTTLQIPLPDSTVHGLGQLALSSTHSGISSPSGFPLFASQAKPCNSRSTMNSEDVLIDELDKVLGPDTPPSHFSLLQGAMYAEGYDECTSPFSSQS
ncbi:hypothetical protein CEUSTIGMA_g8940.t1 [Chlamydomonas eustigma]|uniref:glutamine synthetase n=1 Tax=Chlamydomonas eustigma TaxID=1157962 RepID=A0A250XF30_9CHLO|nr:hypothetical protein CEUSTIGMA_g8940.t1 [Chlamydomonas eustigma]|eukprot:GAX81512.1 hypothetical protein CEUSTIGMA_g8940.t1 [Chlamydomonas eustigma]